MAARNFLSIVSLVCVGIVALVVIVQRDAADPSSIIDNETIAFSNLPGLRAGFSLTNFSSAAKTPGLGLFMALVSLGKLPNPSAMAYTFCGKSVFGQGESCDTAVPAEKDVIIRNPPVVYGYSNETEILFKRVKVVAVGVFVLAAMFLSWSLSFYIPPILASLSVMFVCYQNPPPLVIRSEILFPAILFFYLASIASYLRNGKARWLLLATFASIGCFFLRPVFIYLVSFQCLISLYFLAVSRRMHCLIDLAVIGVSLIWFFVFSPIQFFSDAGFLSAALRTAILSDAKTVECVGDPKSKAILSAYIESIYNPAISGMNYIERYYAFAAANSYRIELPNHPMYQEAEMQSFSKPLPLADIDRMLRAAERCNFERNIIFMLTATKWMLGDLSPPMYLYLSPRVLLLLFFLSITLSILLLIARRRYATVAVVIYPILIYLSMIFIVALKQGTESRYTFTVEPLFALAAATGVSVLCQEILQWAMVISGTVRSRALADPFRRR